MVYGGTPQGIMAAVAASRQGQRVVLVAPGGRLGGVLTQGWLATLDLSADSRGYPLSRGMVLDLRHRLGHDNSFDVGEMGRLLNGLLSRSRVRVLRDAALLSVGREAGQQNRLGCPVFAQGGRRRAVCASVYLDASDDAELAARAGAPFTLGRADTGRDRLQMAAGLVFRLRGVRWPALRAVLRQQGNGLNHLHSLGGRTLVGLDTLAAGYLPSDPRRFFLRGFNGARQDDGSLLLNALLLLGVDGTDPASVRAARQAGDLEARRVTRYLRRALPSVFGSVSYGGAAPQLYLRETRHLV
ncbi:MAG: FAD-dependent oxidoreductase, partial [Deinococcus sp.]